MVYKDKRIIEIINFEKAKQVGSVYCDKNLEIKAFHEDKFEFIGLKEKLKKFPKFYRFLIVMISHSYCFTKIRNKLIKTYLDAEGVVVNIASGNYRINQKIINIDLFAYPNVDIVSDATNLCIKNDSVDFIINETSLEHIYNYKAAVTETFRVLKKDGVAYFVVPFIYEFHASPNDFHRFTKEGLKRLFKEAGFRIKEIGILSGPASSFEGILIEFFSILFSFGFQRLYKFWVMFFMILLFPIKFLDFFLNRIPFASNIAANFYIVVEKI